MEPKQTSKESELYSSIKAQYEKVPHSVHRSWVSCSITLVTLHSNMKLSIFITDVKKQTHLL